MRSLTCAVALVAVASAAAAAELLEDNSFKAPFTSFDGSGSREVGKWTSGGSSLVNKHFVRLTPDRQVRVRAPRRRAARVLTRCPAEQARLAVERQDDACGGLLRAAGVPR